MICRKERLHTISIAVSTLLILQFFYPLCISATDDEISRQSTELNEAEEAELSKMMTFEEYLRQNPRDYVDDIAERKRRKQIFDDNTLFIAKHNASPEGKSFRMRQTDKELSEFSKGATIPGNSDNDVDENEGQIVTAPGFTTRKTGLVALFRKRPRPVIPDGPEGSPTHIDSDLRYCSLNNDVQGDGCGSCYAFAYNSFAEWHYCKLTNGGNINFSEQYIINCGKEFGLKGCHGGKISTTKSLSKAIGFKLEKDLPYKGKEGSCKGQTKDENIVSAMIYGWTRLIMDRTHWEEILNEQPIVVSVKLPEDYKVYDHGIHHGEDCLEHNTHGMVLMGYGSDNGEPYWILKNTQGLDWGESGYFRLSRSQPLEKCFIDGYVGKYKFSTLGQDAFDDFYDSLTVTPVKRAEIQQDGNY